MLLERTECLEKEAHDMDPPMNISCGLQSIPADALSNTRGCSAGGDLQKDRASELKRLEDYFNVLEDSRRDLQRLLQEQKEDQELALHALERQRMQETYEWETLMIQREEALQRDFMSVLINREKMLKNLRKQSVSLSPLEAVNEAKCSMKHEPTGSTGVTLQCASSKEKDLHKIAVMEEKVRMAETKKEQKALQKAEKAAKKAQKKKDKEEGKKLGRMDDTLPSCSASDGMNTESDRKTKKGPGFFRRLFSRKNK